MKPARLPIGEQKMPRNQRFSSVILSLYSLVNTYVTHSPRSNSSNSTELTASNTHMTFGIWTYFYYRLKWNNISIILQTNHFSSQPWWIMAGEYMHQACTHDSLGTYCHKSLSQLQISRPWMKDIHDGHRLLVRGAHMVFWTLISEGKSKLNRICNSER